MTQPNLQATKASRRTTIAVIMVLVSLSLVVAFNYYIKVRRDLASRRLAMNGRLEKDLELKDHTGKPRQLSELKGKVFIVGWLYTTCPRGCAGLAVEMQALQKQFGSNPAFAMVSVSLDPAHDTPEVLGNWSKEHGMGGDNWWFVTGVEKDLVGYMEQHLGLWRKAVDPKEKVSPEDNWYHPVAFRLVDHKGNVRGDLYYPNHPTYEGKYFPRDIRGDIEELLKEAEQKD